MSDDGIATKMRSHARVVIKDVDPTVVDALFRLSEAAVLIADILDGGERDPHHTESQELEEAAIAYGRAVRDARKGKR